MIDVLPVVCGPDVADYAFARIMHEYAGLRSLVVTEYHRGSVDNSRILDMRLVERGTLLNEDRFIACLKQIEGENPGKRLLLFVNTDQGVEFATKHRDELEPQWFLPFASYEAVARANSKDDMAAIYSSLGLSVPVRAVVDPVQPSTWNDALSGLQFPVVMKPENGRDLDENISRGLRKLTVLASHADATDLLTKLHDAGVRVPLLCQELIPGDDTQQWVINGYIDSRGRCAAVGSGRVLIGLHQPALIGNAGAILLERNDALIADALRVVEAVGLRGFFSMDVKIDPRTQRAYWLDLNPRIGRSHYYLKVGGIDMARAVIDDMSGREPVRQTNTDEGIYSILPSLLLNSTYLTDKALRARVSAVRRRRRPIHPLAYARDRHVKRTAYRLLSEAKQAKELRTWYPTSTETGF